MQKKIRIDVDELEVESFETQEEPQARGTVQAHASYGCSASCYSCDPPDTCAGNTCQFESCDGVCDSWFCSPWYC
jgi:hypothetical protein